MVSITLTISKSTLSLSLSDARSLSLNSPKAFHIPYSLWDHFTLSQRIAVSHTLSHEIMSPRLKLHHPANRSSLACHLFLYPLIQ